MDPLIRLERRDGKLLAWLDPSAEPVTVLLAWARPVSAPDADIAILTEKKKELRLVPNLEAFQPDSRSLARAALEERYLVPAIHRICNVRLHLGNRYFDVETDRGPRTFLLRDPNRDVVRTPPATLTLRDTLGNRFRIPDMSRLDSASLHYLDRAL